MCTTINLSNRANTLRKIYNETNFSLKIFYISIFEFFTVKLTVKKSEFDYLFS
jgi:hypothetical protein